MVICFDIWIGSVERVHDYFKSYIIFKDSVEIGMKCKSILSIFKDDRIDFGMKL